MKAVLIVLLLVASLLMIAGCTKQLSQTTTTTHKVIVTSTTLPPVPTEMDSGIGNVTTIENNLDMTTLDKLGTDLDALLIY